MKITLLNPVPYDWIDGPYNVHYKIYVKGHHDLSNGDSLLIKDVQCLVKKVECHEDFFEDVSVITVINISSVMVPGNAESFKKTREIFKIVDSNATNNR